VKKRRCDEKKEKGKTVVQRFNKTCYKFYIFFIPGFLSFFLGRHSSVALSDIKQNIFWAQSQLKKFLNMEKVFVNNLQLSKNLAKKGLVTAISTSQ
jgi:hypothetical protein